MCGVFYLVRMVESLTDEKMEGSDGLRDWKAVFSASFIAAEFSQPAHTFAQNI